MPSANKTPNLGLNEWQGNEYVKRLDFVEDNQAIDEAFGDLEGIVSELSEDLGNLTDDVAAQGSALDAHKAEDATDAHLPQNVGLGNVINVEQLPATYGDITTKAASFTLTASDLDKIIVCTNTTAITITCPSNDTEAIPLRKVATIIRQGSGTVTFLPSSGVTLHSKETKRAIDGQHACVALVKTDTDIWHLFGALE